ncbi:MAG: FhaA domain-containing protein, partial [Candidatus Nanopelagicales bacterium]
LDQFEVSFNELSNGALTHGGLNELQPVEVAAAVQQEIERVFKEISPGTKLIEIRVELPTHDFERLGRFIALLNDRLRDIVQKFSELKRYPFAHDCKILVVEDPQLPKGVLRATAMIEETIGDATLPNLFEEIIQDIPELIEEKKPVYEIVFGGEAIELSSGTFAVGRGENVSIQVPDSGVSRKHLQIVVTDDEIIVEDLNSTNGTFINGKQINAFKVTEPVSINLGSSKIEIRIKPE